MIWYSEQLFQRLSANGVHIRTLGRGHQILRHSAQISHFTGDILVKHCKSLLGTKPPLTIQPPVGPSRRAGKGFWSCSGVWRPGKYGRNTSRKLPLFPSQVKFDYTLRPTINYQLSTINYQSRQNIKTNQNQPTIHQPRGKMTISAWQGDPARLCCF